MDAAVLNRNAATQIHHDITAIIVPQVSLF